MGENADPQFVLLEDYDVHLNYIVDSDASADVQVVLVSYGLSEAEIGIVYMYSFFLHGKGLLIIRADRTEEAREVLLRSGLHCVSEKEIVDLWRPA